MRRLESIALSAMMTATMALSVPSPWLSPAFARAIQTKGVDLGCDRHTLTYTATTFDGDRQNVGVRCVRITQHQSRFNRISRLTWYGSDRWQEHSCQVGYAFYSSENLPDTLTGSVADIDEADFNSGVPESIQLINSKGPVPIKIKVKGVRNEVWTLAPNPNQYTVPAPPCSNNLDFNQFDQQWLTRPGSGWDWLRHK